MKYQKLKLILLGMTATLTVACASSDERPRGGDRQPPSFSEMIEKMDSNGDGKLSEAEVKGPLKRDFSAIDSDGDGYLTEDELGDAPKPQGGPRQRPLKN